MKKRLLIPLLFLISCIAIMLVVTIFQLYKEAEKVQRSIFVNEVLIAGESVVNKIDATLKNDTIALSSVHQVNSDSLPKPTVYKRFTNKFLLDSASQRPIGIINTTFDFNEDNTIYALVDTLYFDTNYLASIQQFDDLWGSSNMHESGQAKISKNQAQLVEMDSNDVMLLNRDFLYRIIKEALAEEKITSSFDFALYNAYTAHFVVNPMLVEKEEILQSEYLFKLKNNDKFIAPHYLILYFPSERSIFFQRMSTIVILIVCFIILIVLICGGTLTALYRQKRAADVKNDFINNMTHEFKTPISTISQICESLEDKNVDSATKTTYVSIIKDENIRLQKMVENILLTAQLNKGQLRMNVELVDVRALIEKVLNSLSLQVISKGGKMSAKMNATEHCIFADPVHIENIIVNLLENALKYSPNRPFIEIRTKNEGKNLVIEVEDHGIGIAKKETKRIFNEFYRVSQGNRHDTKGFGLGLGYVKKIVSLHHGSVTVKSELGKGSTFIVSLPIKM